MVPTTSVTHSIAPIGADVSGALQPETGEFDFLSYLLGLESFQAPQATEDGLEPLANTKPTEKKDAGEATKSDRAWLSLFLQQEKTTTSPVAGPTSMTTSHLENVATPETPSHLQTTGLERARGPQVTHGRHEAHAAKAHAEAQMSPLSEDAVKWLEVAPHEAPMTQKAAVAKYAPPVTSRSDQQEQIDTQVKPATTETSKPVTEDRELHMHREATHLKPSNIEHERKRSTDNGSDTSLSSFDPSSFNLGSMEVSQPVVAKPVGNAHASMHTVPEIFSRVESMVQQGGGTMTVRLTPPDLGQVEIHVTAKGKKVEIEMLPSSETAKSALESKIEDLKSSLQSQDLILSKMDVHVSHETASVPTENLFSANGGGQFQQTLSQGHHGDSRGRDHAPRELMNSSGGMPRVASSGAVQAARQAGRVDLRI